jgi:hypothetical protein
MKTTVTIVLLSLALTGCGTTQWLDTQPGTVRVGVAGTPEVRSDGFVAWIPLDRPNGRGSIQSVDNGVTVGVEYHASWLWRPDRHSLTASAPVEYHRRVMTIREGEVEGIRMAFYGVALLHGWGPRQNRVTQWLYGQQGQIVSEDLSTQTVWSIEYWGTMVPPKLVISCLDTGDSLTFFGD